MEPTKINLQKADPKYYKATKSPQILELDAFYFLSISGQSSPEDQSFLTAIGSLYSVAYGIKFICKKEGHDFTVPKMESFWFIEGGSEMQQLFQKTPREEWMWKIMIRMPDIVTQNHYFQSMETLKSKKDKDCLEVKFELIKGGHFAQILHTGSYEEETESIQTLHSFIAKKHYEISGYHREIYLNDPRRTATEKLRTILRYRVQSVK